MSDQPVLLQSDNDASAALAVLYERTTTMGREMRELKDSQREQMTELKESQRVQMNELRDQNKKLGDKLDDLLAKMNQAQGGWRTLMLVGGAAASIGGFATWFLSHVVTVGPRS
jgi:hypothetical protein